MEAAATAGTDAQAAATAAAASAVADPAKKKKKKKKKAKQVSQVIPPKEEPSPALVYGGAAVAIAAAAGGAWYFLKGPGAKGSKAGGVFAGLPSLPGLAKEGGGSKGGSDGATDVTSAEGAVTAEGFDLAAQFAKYSNPDGVGGESGTPPPDMTDRKFRKKVDGLVKRVTSKQQVSVAGEGLGDEGGAYLLESLAFNRTCVALDASSNMLGEKAVVALCEALRNNKKLATLNLSSNGIRDEGVAELAEALAANETLTSLNLSGNSLTDFGAKTIAEMLKTNTALTSLDLSNNEIEYEGAVAIAEALAGNKTLKTFRFSANYLGALGASVLANGLRANESIRDLAVAKNNLGLEGTRAVLRALCERADGIEVLDVSGNDAGVDVAEDIAAVVKRWGGETLQELNISDNALSDFGAGSLGKALTAGEDVAAPESGLSDPGVGSLEKLVEQAAAPESEGVAAKAGEGPAGGDSAAGASTAAQKEPKYRSLQRLLVSGNDIGPDGMKGLAPAFSLMKLSMLDVSSNPLYEGGARAVCNALYKFGVPVRELRMAWCKAGPNGGMAVGDLLSFSTTLETLDLRSNDFKNDGLILLSRGLRAYPGEKMREINLEHNMVEDDGMFMLAQAIKNNPAAAPLKLRMSYNYNGKPAQIALEEARDFVFDTIGRDMELWY
ncbi:unnamed protein product [Pedinophyceae sp. YPF-701]|nr:unnamed protein product [Pedinophyceae sp. YPF-701]